MQQAFSAYKVEEMSFTGCENAFPLDQRRSEIVSCCKIQCTPCFPTNFLDLLDLRSKQKCRDRWQHSRYVLNRNGPYCPTFPYSSIGMVAFESSIGGGGFYSFDLNGFKNPVYTSFFSDVKLDKVYLIQKPTSTIYLQYFLYN